MQALWLRPPGNVSDAEYTKFYKALSKVGTAHGTARGTACGASRNHAAKGLRFQRSLCSVRLAGLLWLDKYNVPAAPACRHWRLYHFAIVAGCG